MVTTFEQLLILLPGLNPSERARLLEVLEADPQIAAQRAANQAALAHLDARVAADDDDDDSWWEAFTRNLDSDRLSNRPLYSDQRSPAS